jgi:HEAT repeat protein
MPAGERDALVGELEARLEGLSPQDAEVLGAIAERGGPEAMRAVSEYVLRSPDASALGQSLVGRLDVARDPAAAAVLAEALGRSQSPAALDTLVRLAGQDGAVSMAAPLIALDRDDQPVELRQRVFESLAMTGSAEAIAHLLEVSRQPGQFGEHATLALGQLSSAAPEARAALLAELERASLNPRPELAKAALLESLGTLRVESALPQVAASMRDASERVRNSAVRSLGRMGPSARAHVAEIGRLFVSGSEATRVVVAMSLGSIGGPDAAKELEELSKLPNLGPSLQRTLIFALDHARGAADEAAAASEASED